MFVTGFAFPTNGSFTYTTNFATDGSANGDHTVTFIATDAAGNQSDPVTFHFTLRPREPGVETQRGRTTRFATARPVVF